MTNLEILFLSYVIITVLSLFVVIYNYLTKYETKNQRVYTKIGLVFRLLVSFVPGMNLFGMLMVISEPMDRNFGWKDIKTQELCKRSKLWEKLNSYSKIVRND
jgi:hypothetical protein